MEKNKPKLRGGAKINKKNNSADTVQRVDEFEAENISKNKERKHDTDISSLEN